MGIILRIKTSPPTPQPQQRLKEVSFIRPLIILSLVLDHSFVKIAAGGLRRNDYQLPTFYEWLNYFNIEATLEMFVMISGYLFAYQCITLQRKATLWAFMVKKAHRLLLPMLVFGILYYYCFYYNTDTFSVSSFLVKLLSGCGHLWFLPMLFWCLLLLWLIEKYELSGNALLVALAFLSMIRSVPIPFGLNSVSHYLFYAYFGYYLYQHRDIIVNYLSNHKYFSILMSLLYILLVAIGHSSLITDMPTDTTCQYAVQYALRSILELPACLCGIIALFTLAISSSQRVSLETNPSWIKQADKVSFGIYLYHQFLLIYLYHYTPIISEVNPWLLPWIGFLFSYTISWLLAHITLKTKVGRYLIG